MLKNLCKFIIIFKFWFIFTIFCTKHNNLNLHNLMFIFGRFHLDNRVQKLINLQFENL